jgi:UDPglucose 6-dehydrogenase
LNNEIPAGSRIGVIGISYKPHTDVTEESPALALVSGLQKSGYEVIGWDPKVVHTPTNIFLAKNLEELVANSDYAVITRPMPEMSKTEIEILKKGCKVLDLWRFFNS